MSKHKVKAKCSVSARILKASATNHESEIKIHTSMGLNISMHIREDDHNAINRQFKLSPGPNTAASCAGHDRRNRYRTSSHPELSYELQQYNTKSRH